MEEEKLKQVVGWGLEGGGGSRSLSLLFTALEWQEEEEEEEEGGGFEIGMDGGSAPESPTQPATHS